MGNANEFSTDCVETAVTDGVASIEAASPLTRLHYFDGKFLKADALSQEQAYHRTRVRLSNQAGGWGVVNGLGVSLSGNQISVDGGLAITPAGNFVMNMGGVTVGIDELLKVAEPGPVDGNDEFNPCVAGTPKTSAASGLAFYEVTVGPIDALCGNEPVYGKLCESACVSDSRQPYWREGMVLRLRPINLKLPSSVTIPLTAAHLRNRMASAYFAIEPGSTAPQLSKAGLVSNIWCGTTSLYGRDEVVIGLLSVDGSVTKLDAWGGRRERMDTQARGFWQGRMAMRPWNVFLAQILQFQCQLSGLFASGATIRPLTNCDELRTAIDKVKQDILQLHQQYADSSRMLVERFTGAATTADGQWAAQQVQVSADGLYELSQSLSKIDTGVTVQPSSRLLLANGFQQLPPAGYLPVELGKVPVTDQMTRWFGEGVRLHYHAVRADEIGHLVEQAQHLDRISLTQGLDDPHNLEDVEIFLPGGTVSTDANTGQSTWWQATEDEVSAVLGLILTAGSKKAALTNLDQPVAASVRSFLGATQQTQEAFSKVSYQSAFFGNLFTDTTQLSGLARTDARPDGSFGFTLIAGFDDTTQAQATKTAPASVDTGGMSVAPAANPLALRMLASASDQPIEMMASDVNGTPTPIGSIGERTGALHSYYAADVTCDPFSLEVGQQAKVTFEWHLSATQGTSKAMAITVQTDGGLTVSSKRDLGAGVTELVVDLLLDGQATTYMQPPPNAKIGATNSEAVSYTLSLKLTRRTGTQGGAVAVQLTQIPNLPLAFSWQLQPLQAKLRVQVPDSTQFVGTTMQGLSGIPVANSALRIHANDQIDAISSLSLDASFSLRAQQRLFDTTLIQTKQSIVAATDWLMFRRARTLLCDPNCKCTTTSASDAVQVWHVQVGNLDQLKALTAAVDNNNAKALSSFKFNAVGVLHYPDESADATESEPSVLSMWRLAKPAARVVLGRAWERQPATGQGWQNRSRLLNLLKEISSLTSPAPATAISLVKALPQGPSALDDEGTDGGMLVVTMDKTIPHRVIMLPESEQPQLMEMLTKSADDGWQYLLNLLSAAKSKLLIYEDLTLNFDGVTLDAGNSKSLDDKRIDMTNSLAAQMNGAQVVGRYALRVQAKGLDASIDAEGQFQTILKDLPAVVVAGVPDHFDLSATDLGNGAQVCTVVFFQVNQVTGQA